MKINFTRAFAIGVACLSLHSAALAQDAKKVIAITQFVEHPALDKVRKGALQVLAEAGYTEKNTKVVYESAQGDMATTAQIASRFTDMSPDLIIAIATPSAQSFVRTGTRIPVLFGAITDPIAAGLIKDTNHPGGTVTGTVDRPNVKSHLSLIKQLTPGVKRIGTLYNPAEANSRVAIEDFIKQARAGDYEVVALSIASSAEIYAAASNLVERVDAIYVPIDNTVVSGVEAVVGLAIANKLPLFSAETDGVARGALAAVGYDYYDVGLDTGKMAVRILKGEKPGDMAVVPPSKSGLLLNLKTANKIGITIPDELIKSALEVIK